MSNQQVGLEVKRIHRLDGEGALRAFCDVVVGSAFLIKGIRVVEGKKGVFVSMPQEAGKDGNWYDTVVPLTKEARQQVSEMVLAAYESKGEHPAAD